MQESKYKNIAAALSEKNVKLIAVSKYQTDEAVMQLYACGQRAFGENKVQDLAAKYERMPKDIEWHMIGHLQSNKVKYIAAFIAMIHSVDNIKLLHEINRQAAKHNRIIPCLLQVHIAAEDTKFGFLPEEVAEAVAFVQKNSLTHLRIAGLMGMATNTADTEQISREFALLQQLFMDIKKEFYAADDGFNVLSMGMSSDYTIAIENGSNCVRLGSLLFS